MPVTASVKPTGAVSLAVQTAPVTSTETSKLVTKNPCSAVILLVNHLRLRVKSRIVENQLGRPILLTEHLELVLTEDEILSPLLLEN